MTTPSGRIVADQFWYGDAGDHARRVQDRQSLQHRPEHPPDIQHHQRRAARVRRRRHERAEPHPVQRRIQRRARGRSPRRTRRSVWCRGWATRTATGPEDGHVQPAADSAPDERVVLITGMGQRPCLRTTTLRQCSGRPGTARGSTTQRRHDAPVLYAGSQTWPILGRGRSRLRKQKPAHPGSRTRTDHEPKRVHHHAGAGARCRRPFQSSPRRSQPRNAAGTPASPGDSGPRTPRRRSPTWPASASTATSRSATSSRRGSRRAASTSCSRREAAAAIGLLPGQPHGPGDPEGRNRQDGPLGTTDQEVRRHRRGDRSEQREAARLRLRRAQDRTSSRR